MKKSLNYCIQLPLSTAIAPQVVESSNTIAGWQINNQTDLQPPVTVMFGYFSVQVALENIEQDIGLLTSLVILSSNNILLYFERDYEAGNHFWNPFSRQISPKAYGPKLTAFATKLKRLFKENFYDPGFNITALAKRMYKQPDTIRRQCIATFGITPKKLLTHYRLAWVRAYLLEKKTLEQIAELAGFSSASSLSRTFKAETGLSPTQFLDTYHRSKVPDKIPLLPETDK